jgi:tetratricopeptide (TPR) repeat protein
VTEGKRWLEQAFACQGEASEMTRALAVMGRGLINLLSGSPAHSDADLIHALAVFREGTQVREMALAYSFYAEIPYVQGDSDEARRRRLEVLAFYAGLPDDPFTFAARAYSRARLGTLDGDLVVAEQHYREAAAGFAEGDRPVMRTICLGMLADFDERAGRYGPAVDELEEAVRLSDSLGLRGFNGSLLSRLAWVLLQNADVERAEVMARRALDQGRRLRSTQVLFLALTASAVLHRRRGQDDQAASAATEAVGLYLAGWPRRFRNRIDPELEILTAVAACCAVLGMLAVEEGDGAHGAQLLGHANHLRGDGGGPVPAFQHDDISRAQESATALLGRDGFAAAFDQGERLDLGELLTISC